MKLRPCRFRLFWGVSSLTLALMTSVAFAQAEPSAGTEIQEIPEMLDSTSEQAEDISVVAASEDETLIDLTPATSEWAGSLMFDDEKVKNLLAVYRAYLMGQRQDVTSDEAEGLDVEALLNQMDVPEEAKETPEEVLKFSLNSIVYENANDWSIWVNGVRYGRKQAMEGFILDRSTLKVIDANDKSITYIWTPKAESFDRVQTRWEEKEQLGNLVENPKEALKQHVVFDKEAKTVTITMRPNQTFISQFMSVMEGRDAPRQPATADADAAMDGVEETPVIPTPPSPFPIEPEMRGESEVRENPESVLPELPEISP